jgi:hypothetical protein
MQSISRSFKSYEIKIFTKAGGEKLLVQSQY